MPYSARSPVRIEHLLDRQPVLIDRALLTDFLGSRTVLLTGAGGSIGHELARQLLDLRPLHLILVDVSEYNLYRLERALQPIPFPGKKVFSLTDIRDETAMTALMRHYQPDVVFHAAAYKHVPLMEEHPIAAFQNNALATTRLLGLAEQVDTEQFIFISTDKAVAPTSVMGTTKRFAEWYVRAANGPVRTKTVRFGNVFGSLGSVVEVFTEQIEVGGPVTVTHPAMERYFMSVHEACCLILQTLLLESAPVYTLRMDPPVRIQWLAEQMIRLLNPTPKRRIPIEHVGIRPGEKLHEQLWEPFETPTPTGHRDIQGLMSHASYSRAELDAQLTYLAGLCTENQTDSLRKMLSMAAPVAG